MTNSKTTIKAIKFSNGTYADPRNYTDGFYTTKGTKAYKNGVLIIGAKAVVIS